MKLALLVQKALREQGMLADTAVRGEDALWMAAATPFDVIVLDVNLPGIDGFETVRRLRGTGIRTPVLMLTAVHDRITPAVGAVAGGRKTSAGSEPPRAGERHVIERVLAGAVLAEALRAAGTISRRASPPPTSNTSSAAPATSTSTVTPTPPRRTIWRVFI